MAAVVPLHGVLLFTVEYHVLPVGSVVQATSGGALDIPVMV
jgi:hypothetical protein